MGRIVKLSTQLRRLRDKANVEGTSEEIRQKVMAIYRKRSEYITKEDLILFGIIQKGDRNG